MCGKELGIVEQCFSGGVRKQVDEKRLRFANLLFQKDLQQKGPAYGGPLGAVLPPFDAEPFSATGGLMRPRVPASPTLVLGCQKLPEELRCLSVLFRRLYATQ